MPLQLSPELADAWEHFADMVVQEFVYDAWWGALSPDARFPALVRHALNSAAATLVARATRISVHDASVHILHSLAVRPRPDFCGPVHSAQGACQQRR